MREYTVWFETEEYEDSIYIEAESKAEAIEIAEEMLPAGAVITDVWKGERLDVDEDEYNPPDTLFNLGLSQWDFL